MCGLMVLSKELPYMTSAKLSDFFIPFPLCPHFHATSLTELPYFVCFSRTPNPPPECGRHIWKPPNLAVPSTVCLDFAGKRLANRDLHSTNSLGARTDRRPERAVLNMRNKRWIILHLTLYINVVRQVFCDLSPCVDRPKCENLSTKRSDSPSVFVIEARGRLGNHME